MSPRHRVSAHRTASLTERTPSHRKRQTVNLRYDTLHIGTWATPSTDRTIVPVNAITEEPLGREPEGAEADTDAAMAAAHRTFDEPGGWASWEPARRAGVMERLADAMEKRADGFIVTRSGSRLYGGYRMRRFGDSRLSGG